MNGRTVDGSGSAAWTVAYVMTHYPAVALTFISGEIDEMEAAGGRVAPIAVNPPPAKELAGEDARRRQAATLYLKTSLPAVAAAALSCLLRHPVALPRLAITALRSARTDIGLMARRLAHLGYACLVARRCRELGVTHVHAQFGQAPATIAWFATEIRNFRAPGTARWSFTIHGFQDFVDETVARLDLKAASARFVVCVSSFTKSQLCRITDARLWDRFHVIRCGIDLDRFRLRPPRPLGSPPKILIVGRLSPEKGHLLLFRALRRLRDRGRDVQVEVVGGGPFHDTLRLEAESLGVQDRVVFFGELEPEQVRVRLAEADIFCMASFAEGLPISIMEAMAVGVPVVTTWISGIPELATDGVTALTVPPGDDAALADAVERLVSDERLREDMVVAARAKVERLHSRRENARELAALFEEVAGRQAGGGRRPYRAESEKG